VPDTAAPHARLLPHQAVVLVGGLCVVTAVSWLYLLRIARDMGATCCAAMATPGGGGMSVAWMLAMWVVMMAAMMVPTAAPMTVLFARFVRGRDAAARAVWPAALLLLGYVLAWSLYGSVAAALQIALERLDVMSPMAMKLERPAVGGAVLVGAGLFQWTPWKRACLRRCRSPIGFIMTAWRDGSLGALRMGLHHGLYCIGCCWAMMLLLFALGAMNLAWIGALTALVLLEKLAPRGDALARMAGIAMVAGGVWMIIAAR
jgi:predicted metal-binding membrane protein